MCYDSLVSGEATEKPIAQLLRDEVSSAVKDGLVAAVVVAVVLFAGGTGVALTLGSAAGALALGIVLHQVVLVAGAWLMRWRAESVEVSPREAV